MVKDGNFRVNKLNVQNYQLWKMQMEYYLYKDIFLPLRGITKNLATMKDEEWEVLDRNALGNIRMCLAVSTDFNIWKEKKNIGYMKALDRLYELTVENRGIQKERGKILGNCLNYRKGRSKYILGNIKCWNCGKKGHLEKDCRAPKKQRDGEKEKNQEENVTGDVLQDGLIFYLDNTTDSWVVNSGDSFHVTPHRKYFQDYVQGDFGKLYLGDYEPCQIFVMGNIKKNNGNQWLLKEVRHIPYMRRNIIST
jgi:hypothetical protein